MYNIQMVTCENNDNIVKINLSRVLVIRTFVDQFRYSPLIALIMLNMSPTVDVLKASITI